MRLLLDNNLSPRLCEVLVGAVRRVAGPLPL